MLSRGKNEGKKIQDGKRAKEMTLSFSFSGMSHLSDSSEETLEVLVHKSHIPDGSNR